MFPIQKEFKLKIQVFVSLHLQLNSHSFLVFRLMFAFRIFKISMFQSICSSKCCIRTIMKWFQWQSCFGWWQGIHDESCLLKRSRLYWRLHVVLESRLAPTWLLKPLFFLLYLLIKEKWSESNRTWKNNDHEALSISHQSALKR